jgi:hypothetical protein
MFWGDNTGQSALKDMDHGKFMTDNQAEKRGHSFPTLRLTLPALLCSDERR